MLDNSYTLLSELAVHEYPGASEKENISVTCVKDSDSQHKPLGKCKARTAGAQIIPGSFCIFKRSPVNGNQSETGFTFKFRREPSNYRDALLVAVGQFRPHHGLHASVRGPGGV